MSGPHDSLDEIDGPLSPFDRGPTAEADLWFLPQDWGGAAVWPPVQAAPPLLDPGEWARAQDGLSRELAELTQRFGMLQERLAGMGPGALQRLALSEAADLSWWAGGRITADRLGLWLGAHLGGAGEDGLDLAQAGWAARRLMAGQGPQGGGWADGIARFLGRGGGDADLPGDLIPNDLIKRMEAARGLHPVTQGALLFHGWRLTDHGPACHIEAAVMAAAHAGAGMAAGMGGTVFLPLAMAGAAGLRAAGPAPQRLAHWISGATQAVQVALARLDRVRLWQIRAEAVLGPQQGRTPRQVAAVVADWPMVSAALACAQTGASRAAVQRSLAAMQAGGLIREVTGQGRYRVWTAKV
jgi:hypothetical protein